MSDNATPFLETQPTGEFYMVEKLLKKRNRKGKTAVYFVKWLDYDSRHNSWVPEEHFRRGAIEVFKREKKEEQIAKKNRTNQVC